MKLLSELFHYCAFEAKYQTVGLDVDYCFVEDDSNKTLYIYFAGSKDIKEKMGWVDWLRNFWFFPKFIRPYEEMKYPFKVHGGFLAAWDEVKHIVGDKILEKMPDNSFRWQEIIIVGYSHGGALSGLCFEFCQYWRSDLHEQNKITGFGFESPRFLHCYSVPKELKQRWKNYYVIRNNKDLVTHCPPWLLCFCYVGKVVKMKTNTSDYRKPKCIGAHYQDAVLSSLQQYEEKEGPEFYKK